MSAGDFEEVYGPPAPPLSTAAEGEGEEEWIHKGQWSAVVTCFFIDCVRIPARLAG